MSRPTSSVASCARSSARVADACEICYHLVSTGVRAQEHAAEALAYKRIGKELAGI